MRFLSLVLMVFGVVALPACTGTSVPSARSTAVADEKDLPSKSGSPPADAGKSPDRPLEIAWDDLNLPLPVDSTYESWMLTSRAKAVIDRYVRISGYMYAGIAQKDAIRTFPLLRDKDCPFGPGGHAHHAIEVNLRGKLRTQYSDAPVAVEGFLTVAPFTGTDGKTWSVYHLEGTKIQ